MATAHEQLALELSRVSPDDTGRIGMKAANQASLVQAGFRVPEGVILTTDAYMRYSSSAIGDDPELRVSPKSRSGLRLLLEGIVKSLGDTPLAVRSSGVAEDLPEASLAGQYETVLGVRGLDSLEDAVHRCWASAASLHATTYREVHGIGARAMAVLIQELVPAGSSRHQGRAGRHRMGAFAGATSTSQGKAVVIVTHLLAETKRVDRTVELRIEEDAPR